MKCPTISPTIIICDDAYLAATASARLAKRGQYVAVMDGPRTSRADALAEAVRRTNALALAKPKSVIACGLPAASLSLIQPRIPQKMLSIVTDLDELREKVVPVESHQGKVIQWGTDAIGVGLIKALYSGSDINFAAGMPTEKYHPSRSGHLVVIEEGEPLSEIIAANYAFSISAGLIVIPKIPHNIAEEIIEDFYSAQDSHFQSATERLSELRKRLRGLCPEVIVPEGGSMTFISRELPLGYGFPECPSTHLFSYPDLGRSVLAGFTAEQPDTRGINVGVVVDPATTPAPEIEEAAVALAQRGILVRGYRNESANVRDVTEMIESFPYDFLIIATHCGDVSGYRWTYEFKDSEGYQRTLVADIAVGFSSSDDPNMVRVAQHMRFHSLDGVDWNDRIAKAKLYVGTAMTDFMSRSNAKPELEPTQKIDIPRVIGSAALQMSDSVYLPFATSLAGNQNPIILNNACTSWRELASRFMFAGARAYIGTIVPVSGVEAQEITRGLLSKHFGKPLAHALWSTQQTTYGKVGRSPFIITGVYPQKMRTTQINVHKMIETKLAQGLKSWEEKNKSSGDKDSNLQKDISERVRYHARELKMFRHFMKQK